MAVIAGRYDPFGRITRPSPTYPGAGAPQYPVMEEMPDPMDQAYYENRMRQLYQPEMFASERLNALLQGFPDRSKYKPSLARKLTSVAANLSSLGKPQLEQEAQRWSDRVLNEPFYRSLEDWKAQIDPTVQAASNERLANVNLRTAANQIVMQEQADRRIQASLDRNRVLERQGDTRLTQADERIRQGDERVRQGDERLRQGEERLKIARAIARGGVFEMDKLTGQGKMVFKDGSSIPVDVKQLPQEDFMELQQNYALERIGAGADARAETRAKRYEVVDDPNNTGKRILVEITDQGAKPVNFQGGGGPVRPRTRGSTAEDVRQLNVDAVTLKSIHPGGKYIQMRGGRFEGITAPGLIFGPSKAVFDDLVQKLGLGPDYKGIGATTQGATPQTTQPATSAQAQPRQALGTKRADGKVYVRRKSDGQTGWVTNPDPAIYEVK